MVRKLCLPTKRGGSDLHESRGVRRLGTSHEISNIYRVGVTSFPKHVFSARIHQKRATNSSTPVWRPVLYSQDLYSRYTHTVAPLKVCSSPLIIYRPTTEAGSGSAGVLCQLLGSGESSSCSAMTETSTKHTTLILRRRRAGSEGLRTISTPPSCQSHIKKKI